MTQRVTLLADDFYFLEAPKYRDGLIYTSDAHDGKVYTVTPDGASRKLVQLTSNPAGLGFLGDGRLIIAATTDRKLMQIKDGVLSVYADLSAVAAGPLNDFVIDAQDRIFVGNYGYDFHGGAAPRPADMHRVDPDGSVHVVAQNVHFANGMAIINHGRTLVVNETWVGRVIAYDLSADGILSGRRLFADLAGKGPDGMYADAEGALWIGCYFSGEVLRVKDGGEITDSFKFDCAGISCCLGGEDGKTLYMTAFISRPEDVQARQLRGSRIYMARVEVGAA